MLTFSCIFMVLGGLMMLGGAFWSKQAQTVGSFRGRASGTVVEMAAGEPDEEGRLAGVHDYYYPVVAYYANGLLYRSRCSQGSGVRKYAVHDSVEVCYDEENPQHFLILEPDRSHGRARRLYYGGFAVVFLGGVLFLLFATI